MESRRCQVMVKDELSKLGLHYKKVELDEVELKENPSREKLQLIDIALRNVGLELMSNRKNLLIERIKAAIHELIYLSDEIPKTNFSDYISEKVDHNYIGLSNLFSGTEGITIEKYIIKQKIERAKELLKYSEQSLSDIAFKLQYCSVSHLSNQFKKITGLTPSFYRHLQITKCRKSQYI